MIGRRKARGGAAYRQPLSDPHNEMMERAVEALRENVKSNQQAIIQAQEAARLLGAIRREIAVVKAQGASSE